MSGLHGNSTDGDRARNVTGPVSVLCVDDNLLVADALRLKLDRAGDFEWLGWLPSADALLSTVRKISPRLLILDIDMPGRSPFEALADLVQHFPSTRAVIFSGHVRYELIDRAMDAGAWGYVSKNDGEDALVQALRDVAADELGLSQEARAAYKRMA